MITILTIFLRLTTRLYPTGLAFRQPVDGFKQAVNTALAQSEANVYGELLGIFDEILPDNDNFTEDDAAVWERRLAIRTSPGTTLDDRKAAIGRKYASPGDIPARQHYLYLERELQAAGFNVFVHESNDGNDNVIEIGAVIGNQYGTFQYGQEQYGPELNNLDIVANYIDTERDSNFVIPADVKALFYIGGPVLGDVATIPTERREEFRQLILSVKPLQTVGILLINYI